MLLRNLADLCYNLHSGFLIEAGNGVDDRNLFLEWLGQKAHVLEDTGNILPGGIQLVEQLLEEAPLCKGHVAADGCRDLLSGTAKSAAIFLHILRGQHSGVKQNIQ